MEYMLIMVQMEYMLIMVQMEYTMLDDNEYTLKMV